MPNACLRAPLAAVPLLVLAACASSDGQPRAALGPIAVSASEIPPVPVCRNEMRAFVEVTKLAKLHGEAWPVFGPAVDAMKQQILTCFEENRARLLNM